MPRQVFLGDGVAESLAQANQQNLRNKQFQSDEYTRVHNEISDSVRAADTPEKWSAMISRLSQAHGAEHVAGYENFANRGQALADLEQSLPERQFREMQKRNNLSALARTNSANATAEYRKDTLAQRAETNAYNRMNTNRLYELSRDKFETTTNVNALAAGYGKSQDALAQSNKLAENAYGRSQDELGQKNKLAGLGLKSRALDIKEAKQPKPSAISEKISTLVASGLTENQAQGVAAGRYAVSLNPATGERVLVDKGTQKIIPLKQPDREGLVPRSAGTQTTGNVNAAAPQPRNPTLMEAAPDAAGINSNLAAGVAQLPFFGDILLNNSSGAVDSVKAKQVFKVAENYLIRAYSLNPKFTDTEIRRIRELMPQTGYLSNAQDIEIKLQTLAVALRQDIEKNMDTVRSHAPLKERQAAEQSATAMQRFIDNIGSAAEIPTVSSAAEARNLPKGTRFKDPQGNVRVR